MNVYSVLGRNSPLFQNDIEKLENEISHLVRESSFLVLGGAGTIGRAVSKEIFRRKL